LELELELVHSQTKNWNRTGTEPELEPGIFKQMEPNWNWNLEFVKNRFGTGSEPVLGLSAKKRRER